MCRQRSGVRCASVSEALLTLVKISQQATFGRQAVDAGKESLQSFKVGLALQCDQVSPPFVARLLPSLGDDGRTRGCVGGPYLLKPRLLNQPFIFSRRTVHVIANRAARGDLLMRNHSADDQRIA